VTHALLFILVAAQSAAALVALGRLLPGIARKPAPRPSMSGPANAITVIIPTVNEAARLGPCLRGLATQSDVVSQILVVDSRSTDGTPDLVRAAAVTDARIVLLTDDPAPPGWIGKVWALQHALPHVRTEWVLGVDADIAPQPGFAAGAHAAAIAAGYDVVSFAPRFVGMTAAERFVQPAILATLVYRTGVPGDDRRPSRVLANGQCFLARREVLESAGGYGAARASWADDVTLARSIAARGAHVGFLDGSRLYDVRAYTSLVEMWREWGRSVDLSDATGRVQQWADVALLVFAQALPLPLLLAAAVAWTARGTPTALPLAIIAVNALLLMLRLGLLSGLAHSYERRGLPFWLSPLADVAAVFRIALSTVRRPRKWRGRAFLTETEAGGDQFGTNRGSDS
jgi:dolichol-phosphate mannosyltransferase